MIASRWATVLAVTGGAFLSAALTCGPARADYYAFGQTSGHYAILTLQVAGGPPINISTNGSQGWVETNSFSAADPNGNYLAGLFNGTSYANYFNFNLSSITATVTSAKLTLYSGTIKGSLDYSLFGATEAINMIQNGVGPQLALYNEVPSGVSYNSPFAFSAGSAMQDLIFTLNAAAVSDINKLVVGKSHTFAIAGTISDPIPEPSTWAMMLAGFAGLGFVTYHRAAKRRAAIAAV